MTRKMPPHIVLPNGMWRFVKRGGSSSSRKAGKTRARRGGKMVYRKARRSRGGGMGLGSMLKPLLVGAVAGFASKKFAPQVIPYQGAAAGAAGAMALGSRGSTGLLAGAAGGFVGDMLAGGASTGGAATW